MLAAMPIHRTEDQQRLKVRTKMSSVKKSKKGKLQSTIEVESRGVCTNKDREEPNLKDALSSKEKLSLNSPSKENPFQENSTQEKPLETTQTTPLRDNNRGSHKHHGGHRRHSRQELDPNSRIGHSTRTQELVVENSTSSPASKQEILHLSLARQALEAEKVELKRLLEQRESIITELRKQMHHREKTIQAQRAQFEDALRNLQNGKRSGNPVDILFGRGKESLGGGSGGTAGGSREELQLVRDAITSLRSNFRGTDPNQHTLDTLEQAIAVLIERCGGLNSGGGGNGNGSSSERVIGNGTIVGSADKSARLSDKRPQVNGVVEQSTKVIYFTERTVTPFMSTINKRLGDIRLREFKAMFDRPGIFRFHFKSHDPEYGMVKEEIINDDDVLPGVEGKIIAWVEEDTD
ncbi:Dixin [Halocaridina rubra]|uniref:Dixin n=1 Tax=Halocaridina rubra TaxID=373956 RepID=A0AAN8ZYB5_HALRR